MATHLDMHPSAVPVSEEDLTCRLCCKSYASPRLVNCLHTYCQKCIKDSLMKVKGAYVFKCPQCMYETPLKNGSAASLVADIHVQGLQKIYACHNARDAACMVCTLKGDNSEAVHRCLDCDDFLCAKCSGGHNSSSLTASHSVAGLHGLRRGEYDQEILKKHNVYCGTHTNDVCRIFCYSCSEPACVTCVLSVHKEHSYEAIEEAVKKRRLALIEKLNSISLNNVMSTVAELEQLNKEEEAFVTNVTESANLYIDKIKQQSQEVLEMGRQAFAEERKFVESSKSTEKVEYPQTENILKVGRRVAESDGVDIILMESLVQDAFLKLSNENSAKQNRSMTFTARFDVPLEKDFISFHKIPIVGDKAKKARRKRRKQKAGSSQSDVAGGAAAEDEPATDTNNRKSLTVGYKFKSSFSTKIGTDKSEPNVSFMTRRTPKTFLLMDKGNGKLKVFKLTGDMVYLVELSGKCDIFEQFAHVSAGDLVCAIYEDKLLILSRHLKIMDKVPLFPESEKTLEPIVVSFGENVLVGNLPNNEMRVFDTSGKVLRTWEIGHVAGSIQSMNYAGGDKVVCTTWHGTGSVFIESEKNGRVFEVQGDERNGLSWQPTDAVVDSLGHVIVTDPKRNEISIFSSTGSLVFQIDTMENNVAQPNRLIIDENGNIYVSFEGGMVAVYEMTDEENLIPATTAATP